MVKYRLNLLGEKSAYIRNQWPESSCSEDPYPGCSLWPNQKQESELGSKTPDLVFPHHIRTCENALTGVVSATGTRGVDISLQQNVKKYIHILYAAGGSRSRHPHLITELNWNPVPEKDKWWAKGSRPGWWNPQKQLKRAIGRSSSPDR